MKYFCLIFIFLVGCSTWEPCDVVIGASKYEVINKCGAPQKKSSLITESGKSEIWEYYFYSKWLGYDPSLGIRYLYFDNGKLTGIQE